MPIVVKASDKFKPLYNLPKDTNLVVCIGGRGGMKTYEVSKFAAFSATIKKKRIVILRDEKALIKETILNEIWERYNTANAIGALDKYYVKNETELKEKESGKTLVYTKGFRASNNAKAANLKGISDVDVAIIEEGEDIVDQEKYNTFVDSLRKEGSLVIIMMNTPSIQHFLVKRLFNTKQIEDGYFELIPKDLPGFFCIQTSFEDNPHLPAHIISNYNGYGDPTHHLYNYHYYMTAIKGYASTGRKGQIFTKVKPIKLSEYLALPYREIFGQDFGTSSPAALVGVKIHSNTAYIRLLNYKPADVLTLAKMYCTLGFTPADKIVCDYAESTTSIPKLAGGFKDLSIEDYRTYPGLARGFYAVPCTSKDVPARISLMQSMNLYAVEEDTELWDEINNFVYAQDKYKNYTDYPVDDFNHAFFDAAGYVIVSERGGSSAMAM